MCLRSIEAQAHQITDLLGDRSETIDGLVKLMKDINEVTCDIKVETIDQGQNLQKIDEELLGAVENVEQANEQLEMKNTRERTGNKLLIYCVIIAIIVVIILIYLSFIRRDDDDVIIKYEQADPQQATDPISPDSNENYEAPTGQ